MKQKAKGGNQMTNEELLDLLVGRKIVRISRMTPHTAEEAGF